MPDFTPGPWEIYAKYNIMAGRRSVANAGGYSNSHNADAVEAENCANAVLIAAAPDLLLALKAMVEEQADYMKINNLGDPMEMHNHRLACAVITKATGS